MSPRLSQTFGGGRKFAIFLNVVVMAGLALGAAVLVVYLAGFTDFRRRFDLTQSGRYTLSQETVRLVSDLDQDVEIITLDEGVVHYSDPEGVVPAAMEYTTDLLQEYRVRSRGRITVENLNAAKDSDRVIELYRELGIRANYVVVVRSGDSRRILSVVGDLADIDASEVQMGRPPVLRAYRAEEAISSAIYEVTQEKRSKVYVTIGHGELAINSESPIGAARFAMALARDNLEVVPLSLFQTKFVPQDADLVVLLGPKEDLISEEVAALDQYLLRGGRLLYADDPQAGTHSLDPLWDRLGLVPSREIVCHTQNGTLRGPKAAELVIGPRSPGGDYGRHAITEGLSVEADLMVLLMSGAVAPNAETEPRFTSLAVSSADSFQDKNDDLIQQPREEIAGQRRLIGLLEPSGDYDGSRVIYVASMGWSTNVALNSGYHGNEKFVRRAVAYLTGKSRTIRLPPRRPNVIKADLRLEEYDQIFAYVVIWLPLGAVILALLVWLARRR